MLPQVVKGPYAGMFGSTLERLEGSRGKIKSRGRRRASGDFREGRRLRIPQREDGGSVLQGMHEIDRSTSREGTERN